MKKLIYSAVAMAFAFFAASCQKEVLEPVADGNTVTYTVEVPGALKTKALGDEVAAVDKVYYEVYRKDEVETGQPVYEGNASVSNGQASFELEFVKGQKFVVLFWAQNSALVNTDPESEVGMYYISDLRAVQLVNPGASNNVNAQVFAGKDTVSDCVSAKGGKVELTRPVSQLNIFTTRESLKYGTKTITLSESAVTVNGLYTTYNVAEGEAVVTPTTAELIYTTNTVPHTEDTDPNVYVAMNYVGFALQETTTVQVDFTIKTSDGDVAHSVSSVPVKPNYRTNIVGNLLTESTDYNVTLNPVWEEEEHTEIVVSTATDLQTIINNAPDGETVEISLSGDINLGDLASLLRTKAAGSSNSLTIPAGKSIVLNLNGYSMSAVDETSAAYAMIFNNGNLSIVNTAKDKVSKLIVKATVESGWSRRSAVVSSEPGSTLTVGAGIEIEHLGGTSMAYGIDILTNGGIGDVTVTIDGATVKSAYRAIRQFLNSDSKNNNLVVNSGSVIQSTKGNKSVWMQDASAKANRGSLVVEEGAKLLTDAYLDVTAGSTEWPVSVSIAASALQGEATVISENVPALYGVVLKDGYWVIETYLSLVAFVDAVIAAEGTYDGEGQIVKILPLSGKADNTNACLVPNRLQKYGNPEVYYAQYQRFAELQNVSISNVNFVFVPAAIIVQDAWNPAGATTTVENVNGELQFMNSGSVTLTGCTFDKVAVSPIKATSLTVADCHFGDLMAYAIKDITAATTSVTGTEFNKCNGGFWFNAAPTNVTVTGNTFATVGRRGAIQFSVAGDYANTTFNITDKEVEGAFLWQLNETLTYAQYIQILEGNTYTTPCVDGSIIPVQPPVAKVGNTEYFSIDEAIAAWTNNTTLTLLDNVTLSDVVTLKSTEHHILDLSTFTITAAEGKNAFVIQACGTGDSERNAITIKANAENPGGINAGKKSIIYYKYADGGISGNDRPIIKIEGGVFTGSTSSFGTAGIYTIGTAARKCATLNISGGTFNCSINGSGKSKLLISGGTFNYSVGSQGDSTALRLIWGGKFKTLGFMTADSNNTKFWFGTSMANSNVGLYIDDEGYLVVGGPVITDFGDQFAAKATNATKWNSLLQYSSASTNGLYYTNAELAIKKHGETNVELK